MTSASGVFVAISKPTMMNSSGHDIILPYISSDASSKATRFPSVFPIFLPLGSSKSFVVRTNFSLFFIFFIKVRPANILNIWSFPPISTSISIATESYACITGYKNSLTNKSFPFFTLSRNISRAKVCPIVKYVVSLINSILLILPNHSELYFISVFLRSRIIPIYFV